MFPCEYLFEKHLEIIVYTEWAQNLFSEYKYWSFKTPRRYYYFKCVYSIDDV